MSFKDDVRQKIDENAKEHSARQAERKKIETEYQRKLIERASHSADKFYNMCVDAAASGKHELIRYFVDTGFEYLYSCNGDLISQEQYQQANMSHLRIYGYSGGADANDIMTAKPLPKDVAIEAAGQMNSVLRRKGLENADINLIPTCKWEEYGRWFTGHNRQYRRINEIAGYYIRLVAKW